MKKELVSFSWQSQAAQSRPVSEILLFEMDSTTFLGLIDLAWCNRATNIAAECENSIAYTGGTVKMPGVIDAFSASYDTSRTHDMGWCSLLMMWTCECTFLCTSIHLPLTFPLHPEQMHQ